MEFSKVTFENLNGPIASVDRSTKELFIDPVRWKRLSSLHREFVLLHENGHIVLDTSDEIAVNRHAIKQFVNLGELTNDELGYRVSVLSDLLETEDRDLLKGKDNFGDPVSAVAGAVNSIIKALPDFGIGSKARIKEQQKATESIISIEQEKAKNSRKTLIIGGSLLIVVVLLYLILK